MRLFRDNTSKKRAAIRHHVCFCIAIPVLVLAHSRQEFRGHGREDDAATCVRARREGGREGSV